METTNTMNAAESKRNDLLLGTIIGGAAGALIALLLAPKSGRELREDLVSKAQNMQAKGQEWLEAIKIKTASTVQSVGEQGAELMDKTRQAAEQAVSSAHEAADEAAAAIHRATDRAADSTHKAADRMTDAAHETLDRVKPFPRAD